MQKYLSQSLLRLKTFMLFLNFITVLLISSIVLISTQYICENLYARHFLDNISALPQKPELIFFEAIGCFSLLCLVIYIRKKLNINFEKKLNLYTSIIEIILCILIMKSLYMGYSGISFLVFIDIIIHMKENKKTVWFIILLVIVLLISNHDVISSISPMVSINDFISVFPASVSTILLVITHILDSLNLVLFIIFMIIFIANQSQENERISNELSMINQVNTQLKEYAQITEKLGEDKERKRIAREIHDTLGHALTGIAAGIDACIAMIDFSPEETKKQLFVISKVVRQGISDVRNSLNKLRPGALEEHTFKESIVKLIEEFKDISKMDIDLVFEVDNVDFENTKEDILFRVVQESMTNALRHGHATYIFIHIYVENDLFILEIKDNGLGCKEIHKGYGLKHMEERISFIDGNVSFDGNDGFHTYITIPMRKGKSI